MPSDGDLANDENADAVAPKKRAEAIANDDGDALNPLVPLRALDDETHQPYMVFTWIVRLLSMLVQEGVLIMPPPIVSRIFQELSNGMLGFKQAYKIAVLPFPPPLTWMCTG